MLAFSTLLSYGYLGLINWVTVQDNSCNQEPANVIGQQDELKFLT